jgi:hypothetical protein
MRTRFTLLSLALLAFATCGDIKPGGQHSGVPDTFIGQRNRPLGEVTTGGEIILNRETGWR